MSVLTPQAEAQALLTCEQEPIRTPERVQPHGCLLICDLDLGAVTHVSQNAGAIIGVAAADILGKPLNAFLNFEGLHGLRNALSLQSAWVQREFLGDVTIGGQVVQGAVHIRDNRVILELVSKDGTEEATTSGFERLRWVMGRQDFDMPFTVALRNMCRDLQSIVGFDRVMAYRFRPDGSGEVVAERVVPEMDSFLGLRFPASDIPQIARAICLEQPLRLISDTQAEESPILAASEDLPAMDLTLAELRGTSPVHIQYMQNMGVGASLVLPIVVDGVLWGLFSCHHRSPRRVSIEQTMMFELVGRTLNTSIEILLRRDLEKDIKRCAEMVAGLARARSAKARGLFTPESWQALATQTMEMFRCQGVLLQSGGHINSYGLCADKADFAAYLAAAVDSPARGVSTHDALLDMGEVPDGIAGMMRIDLMQDTGAALWLFRTEENETIRWAGAPDKHIEVTKTETRLHPRSSFAEYKATSQGKSRAWEPEDVHLAEALQEAMRRFISLQLELSHNEQRLNLMVQELNHRVRNILSLISSIASQSRVNKVEIEDYVDALGQRLLALARAHNLMSDTDHLGLDIKSVLSIELEPFMSQVEGLSGPDVMLTQNAATMFAVVVHEMMTNAVKYGALGLDAGRVAVDWAQSEAGVRLIWSESGGAGISPPAKQGFGTFLIENGITHQLGGKASINYRPQGVEITMEIPARHVSAPEGQSQRETPLVPAGQMRDKGADANTVLVLEDNFLIASEVKSVLLKDGAAEVHLASNNAAALTLIKAATPDCAVIDLNLGEEDSLQTAQCLEQNGIPFVILSGYSDAYDWVGTFKDVPMVNKPFQPAALCAAVAETLAGSKGL